VNPRRRFDRALAAIVLLLFGSGCAALVYEIVWFQLLQIVVGSSAISLGVLLGTFMGGMCLGSLLLPRLVDRSHHPLRVYAGLELAISAIGVFLLLGMPLVGDVYVRLGGHIAVRVALACACLLLPTMAMGATLPAIARWIGAAPAGVAWLGLFYGGNIAGAVAGTLLAGFYLLRVFDVAVATYVAAAINLAVAAAAWALATRMRGAPAIAEPLGPVGRADDSALVYVSIGLSGATALSAEVVWTRLLSLNFGATVYTFSLILAAVLIGIGTGSGLGALVARQPRIRPRVALGWCQLLLCPAIAWAAYLLTRQLPYWPVAEAVRIDPWLTFRLDLFRSLLVILPAGVLWGASFPLALASVATPGRDPGRLVGGVYAANTLGAIAGSLGTSLLLTDLLGSQHIQQMRTVRCGPRTGWSPRRRSRFSSRVCRPCPAC
jgi:spermidine synthase